LKEKLKAKTPDKKGPIDMRPSKSAKPVSEPQGRSRKPSSSRPIRNRSLSPPRRSSLGKRKQLPAKSRPMAKRNRYDDLSSDEDPYSARRPMQRRYPQYDDGSDSSDMETSIFDLDDEEAYSAACGHREDLLDMEEERQRKTKRKKRM